MARPIEAAPSAVAAPPISVSARAARRIAELLRNEAKPNRPLRVTVSGGGCSGYQYGFAFDDTRNEDDVVIERDGVVVLVDGVSAGFMAGAEIDFVTDLIGAAFQIKNPNASSSCGCGSSFSLG